LDANLEELLIKAGKRAGVSRSELAREALRRQLRILQLEAMRKRIVPFAEARPSDDGSNNELEEVVMAGAATVKQYQDAYRRMRRRGEERGLRIHRRVYIIVVPVLAALHLVLVPQFLWFLFPLAGWGTGLTIHYVFGVRKLEPTFKREEQRVGAFVEAPQGGMQ
jgi:hypothetical protein